MKIFSIRYKLVLIFGALILVSGLILGVIVISVSRRAVTDKIKEHLIDKVDSTAEIIQGKVEAFFGSLEGVARNPILRDSNATKKEKIEFTKRSKV